MRPVRRPPFARPLSAPHQARDPLVEGIGDYCSYCETPSQAAVEHVLPWENKHPGLRLAWDNLLLTCSTCNNYKRSRQDPTPLHDPEAARARYLWPDRDNTARALLYTADNRVRPAPGLGAAQPLADATHALLGFDREPASDLRWRRRRDAWELARAQRAALQRRDDPATREDILLVARSTGFWSVWRAVFADDVHMLRQLNERFAGTETDCFDPGTQALLARSGGRL